MEQERRDDQLAVADLVGHHSADDDAEAEAGQAGAADRPQFGAGEAEIDSPICDDRAAYGEAHARSQNGHETGPQQSLTINHLETPLPRLWK